MPAYVTSFSRLVLWMSRHSDFAHKSKSIKFESDVLRESALRRSFVGVCVALRFDAYGSILCLLDLCDIVSKEFWILLVWFRFEV